MPEIILSSQAERILREKGAKRVSKKGAKMFALAIQDFGSGIADFVVFIAKQAKKKTILKKDVESVVAQIEKKKQRFGLN
ncbi:MAG: hypothetical protein COW47_01240 [Candidatus Huberarchaeum crystalense]|uniref:Transcription factor CBF/NF-Y/archaeal histone domain-containing protein n=1 Tax=Huberarchaeum crystalense TaxID=2014257 RepID=A0A2G9LIS2_HUBC1|nr:hypothetical protein [archaeon]OIP20838.1 MAG: hypothetical protein AUJ91_00110 [archaeon CG2_30_31_98]PIN66415.1 MAG: hypothetical protein COW69_02465 [Candidatus Huberarchaeum crystalense]NCS98213.1 hypothetical protein [archaeon]PIV13561.1 MAG: hypothetical protein COS45_02315 [Candidatus Huberarchaeum crystalense]